MKLHVLERLAATNPDCEIWWDSSPLVYRKWADGVLAEAPAGKADIWREQLGRLFDPDTVETTGKMGFRGVTTNPPLSLQAIQNDPAFWQDQIRAILKSDPGAGVEEVYWRVYLETVRMGAAMVRPVYDASNGKYGFLSGQVDPRFVTDRKRMRSQAFDLAAIAPNVMVKIPGSGEGYELIEELTANGISTNNTTSFTVPQYFACMDAVSRGLATAQARGIDLSRWRSVITHMSARLGNGGDLAWQAQERGIELSGEDILLGELAVLKRAYRRLADTGHPSKMLMCSMRVARDDIKGTASSWHIEKLAGGNFVYTCPPGFIAQLMDVEDRLPEFDANAVAEDIPQKTLNKLLRVPYFRQAYEPDGMAPGEFAQFGAFIATAGEFAAATRKTIDFVARNCAESRQTAA